VLVSDRDAVQSLLSGARRFFVREVRLSAQEKAAIQQASGWNPDDDFYRFYVGRDEQGQMVGALVFVGDATIHGSVRVAVALGPDGKVRGATVTELTEETYPWLKPLIDEQFTRDWVGHDSQSRFVLSDRLARVRSNSMTQFYGEIVASLVQRGTLLYTHGMARQGGTAMLR
jgi:Na+-translocating ferredoxin:NAD+ oxidoreductase RnfG subunit